MKTNIHKRKLSKRKKWFGRIWLAYPTTPDDQYTVALAKCFGGRRTLPKPTLDHI